MSNIVRRFAPLLVGAVATAALGGCGGYGQGHGEGSGGGTARPDVAGATGVSGPITPRETNSGTSGTGQGDPASSGAGPRQASNQNQ